MNNYQYTKNLIEHKTYIFEPILAIYKGKHDLNYLEIGVFEGRTLIWMFENVLTHPSARATGVDCFLDNTKSAFEHNIKLAGFNERINLIDSPSNKALHQMELESFDIIYVDGSHASVDVLTDCIQSWLLLKEGGIMILDDYELAQDNLPEIHKPKLAVDIFLCLYGEQLEILSKGYEVIVKKRVSHTPRFTTLVTEKFFYCWGTKKIYNREDYSPVEMMEEDIKEVMNYLWLKEAYSINFPEVEMNPKVNEIIERLKKI